MSEAIDRASATDVAFLAMDRGAVPQQFGAILVLEGAPDLPGVQALIAGRISAVPRLRQRLVRVPPGCGRPIWIDDRGFDIGHHVREVRCPYPGDEQALLDLTAEIVTRRLPASRPLWSAILITGLADGTAALVVILHHVLADGLGGLAVLANLTDQVTAQQALSTPRRPPTASRLAVDAMRGRLHALSRLPGAWRQLRTAMSAGGGWAPTRATPCSLVRRTGPRRRFGTVRTDVAPLRTAAHRHGATVNDAVLVAVAGALHRVLQSRGESVGRFAVAVPVAGRRSASAGSLGNQVAPLLVTVSGTGDRADRVRDVAAQVRAGRENATGPPPIALVGPVFRLAAALGGYRWYMNHQHRLHTLVSHVRGPQRSITFGGAAVRAIIPVGVGEAGNVTTGFEVLSYAGTLTVTAVVDPDRFPDLSTLTGALRAELAALAALAATG
jgi:WS/DGAT/MGAT family acyltransferase